MNTVIKDKQIEEIKETIENLKESLIDNYLHHFGHCVNVKMDDYEECYVSHKEWTNESYQDATEFANEKLAQAFKEMNINQN